MPKENVSRKFDINTLIDNEILSLGKEKKFEPRQKKSSFDFMSEENPMSKEQLNAYIKALRDEYQKMEEEYRFLFVRSNALEQRAEKAESENVQLRNLVQMKDREILMLRQQAKQQEEIISDRTRNTGSTSYEQSLIAEVMVEAKAYATKIKREAEAERKAILDSVNKELTEMTVSKEEAMTTLIKLRNSIVEIVSKFDKVREGSGEVEKLCE